VQNKPLKKARVQANSQVGVEHIKTQAAYLNDCRATKMGPSVTFQPVTNNASWFSLTIIPRAFTLIKTVSHVFPIYSLPALSHS